jgi:hypothetical protein
VVAREVVQYLLGSSACLRDFDIWRGLMSRKWILHLLVELY